MPTDARTKEKHRKYRLRIRTEALALLGNKCAHCGNLDTRVLDIDHIVPPIKKGIHDKHTHLCLSILKGHKPLSSFQLLCGNCHRIKTLENKDYTPRHKREYPIPQGCLNA